MLLRPYVVNVMRKEKLFFVDEAVFATSLSTLPNPHAEVLRNIHLPARS